MTLLLSYPFRLDSRGYAVTRDDGSNGYYAEELAMMIQTHPGERVMRPAYGVEDPTFRTKFPTAELIMKTSVFGPPVRIMAVNVKFKRDGEADVDVQFDSGPRSTVDNDD